MIRIFLLLGSIAMPSLALAAAPDAPAEIRLSQAEIDRVLADAARKRETGPQAVLAEPEPRKMHGEVGVEVGSDGYRSIYGTSAVELPGDGLAVISFQTSRGRDTRGYYLPRTR